MDAKQIESLLKNLNAQEKKKAGTVSPDYIDFLKDALETAKLLDKSKVFKDSFNAPMKDQFYRQVDKINTIYSGKLGMGSTAAEIESGDEALADLRGELAGLKNVSDMITTADMGIGQQARKMYDNSLQRSQALEWKAKENTDRHARQADEKKVERQLQVMDETRVQWSENMTEQNRNRLDKDSEETINYIIGSANMIGSDKTVDNKAKSSRLNAVNRLQIFYYDNMMLPEQRHALRNITQAQDLQNYVTTTFTEVRTYLEDLRQNDPEKYNNFSDFLQSSENKLGDDLKRVVNTVRYNTWTDWATAEYNAQQELDEYQKLGKQELMQKHGLKTDDQFYFQAMLESNEDYKKNPLNRGVMDVLGMDENALPESIEIGGRQRNLREELHQIKASAYKLASGVTAMYVPEKDGTPHYMNLQEIDSLSTDTFELDRQLGRFTRGLENAGIDLPEKEQLQSFRKEAKNLSLSLSVAERYINDNANADTKETVRPFSMYELQGQMNPDLVRGALNGAAEVQDLTNEINEHYGPQSNSARKEKFPEKRLKLIGDMNTNIKNLTEDVMPKLLKSSTSEEGFFAPLTREQVREAGEAFTKTKDSIADYIRDVRSRREKGEKISEEEDDLYRTVNGMYSYVSEKAKLMDYLDDDRKGKKLSDEIERFNDNEASRRERERETGQPQDSLYDRERINQLTYAMNCKQLMNDGMMIAPFLFEDPQAQRGMELMSMKLAQKNIEDLKKREAALGNVKWENGKRDLTNAPEYRDRFQQVGDYEHIVQYATKNDWNQFEKVMTDAIGRFPDYLKDIEVTDGKGNKTTVNVAQKMSEQIKDAKIDSNIADFMERDFIDDLILGADQNISDVDRDALEYHLKGVKRTLNNAGFSVEAQQALADPFMFIPDGYNEGVMRENINTLFGDQDRTVKQNTMENAKLPVHGTRAKQEDYVDVKMATVRGNFDKTAIDGKEFYTTTEDFRASDFVARIPGEKNVDEVAAALKGLSGREIEEVMAEERKLQFAGAKQAQIQKARDAINKARGSLQQDGRYKNVSDLREFETYDKGEYIESMADLQVMDYLTGVGVRDTNDLRMGFKKNQDGNVELTGLSAANSMKNLPFRTMSAADDKKLVQPEDMLVMSADMYEKVKRWKTALDDPEQKGLTETEKKIFASLNSNQMDGFKRRLNHLTNTIEDPEKTEYSDFKHNRLSKLYGLDVKPGAIRVLNKEQFGQLYLDDLTVGKNEAAPKDKKTAKARNLFDTMADLPQKCSDAIADKIAGRFSDPDEKKFGKGLNSITKSFYLNDKERMDKELNRSMAMHKMQRAAQIMGKAFELSEKTDKEYTWHKVFGDSGRFADIMDSAEKLNSTVADNMNLIADENKYLKNRNAFSPERQKEIENFRSQRLAHIQNLAKEQGQPVPTELPPLAQDQHLFFRSLEAMDELRSKMEKYMDKRKNPSTAFGKERYKTIMDMYNEVNNSIAEYATLTGDTSLSPRTVSATADKPYSAVYSNMYADRTAYEMTTPYYHKTELKKQAENDAIQRGLREMDLRNAARREGRAIPKKEDFTMVDRQEMVVLSEKEVEELKAAAPSKHQDQRKKINIDELKGKEPKKESKIPASKKEPVKVDEKNEVLNNNKPIGPKKGK